MARPGPALTRLTVSSPELLQPFRETNAGKPNADRVKPFNFMLTSHVAAFGHPLRVDPATFQLVSPDKKDARG